LRLLRSIEATPTDPVTVYCCKAGITTGLTIRILHKGLVFQTSSVSLLNATAVMAHNNSTGKPKASGARCVLQFNVYPSLFPI
jgi:hypothetical protein